MRDRLLGYYERELRFIRRLAAEFATRYPAVAGQLLLEPDKCEDPHVERLIEAFAMLTARVQLRLDDEFPQLTEALLNALHPHYLAPVPSATIVQFAADPDRAEATTGIRVPRHALLHARPVGGVRCRFRTAYPVTLWPVELTGADVVPLGRGQAGLPAGTAAALRLSLRTLRAQNFRDLPLGALRFFLDGEPSLVHGLYELLLRNPLGVLVRPAGAGGRTGRGKTGDAAGAGESTAHLDAAPVLRGPECVQPVGFAADEGLLEDAAAAHLGHRLLQEYFCFPDKLQFVDVGGLDEAALAGVGETLELLVLLDHLPLEIADQVGPENFQLGCAPAVNLFPHQCDPIPLQQTISEYQVTPDVHAALAYEVVAVREVESLKSGPGAAVRAYRPFYALRHGDPRDGERAFWHAGRRPSRQANDAGTEVFLTLVDPDGRPLAEPPVETLSVQALCSNRDLPAHLPLGDQRGDFQIEGRPGVTRVRALRRPTAPLRAVEPAEQQWRLLSLLQLNYLSLLGPPAAAEDGGAGGLADPVALRELLSLLDFARTAATRQRIAGLTGVRARRVLRRVTADGQRVFARGLEVTVELDETKFAGSGVYLFASLLERFLGLYATINSFTQTVAVVRQREGVLKRWPPRAGDMQLL